MSFKVRNKKDMLLCNHIETEKYMGVPTLYLSKILIPKDDMGVPGRKAVVVATFKVTAHIIMAVWQLVFFMEVSNTFCE